jgi:hypothetical protein
MNCFERSHIGALFFEDGFYYLFYKVNIMSVNVMTIDEINEVSGAGKIGDFLIQLGTHEMETGVLTFSPGRVFAGAAEYASGRLANYFGW